MYLKQQIAQSFGKAASSYDSAAQLQRTTGHHLLKEMQSLTEYPDVILDLGTGTGYFAQQLAKTYPHSHILAADISDEMLNYAIQTYPHPHISYLCADADCLPLPSGSIDCIFSNLMLQWSPCLFQTLKQLKSCLKPQGFLFFATLGERTLYELRKSWQKIDDDAHVHDFFSYEELLEIFTQAGYQNIRMHQAIERFYYPNLLSLFSNLKSLGAHNLKSNRSKGLLGKHKFSQLTQNYEVFRAPLNKMLPATYEIFYGRAS